MFVNRQKVTTRGRIRFLNILVMEESRGVVYKKFRPRVVVHLSSQGVLKGFFYKLSTSLCSSGYSF